MLGFNSWDEDNSEYSYANWAPRSRQVKIIPAGMNMIDRPKYSHCSYYHYLNPASQNALICQTHGFPDYFNPKAEVYTEAYSDRMSEWDYENYKAACISVNAFEQVWAYKLPSLSDDELRAFAQKILKLPILPTHVRIVHWYNVATGYSCPTVAAIYKKE